MKKILLIIITLVLLIGCAPGFTWQKPGVTQDQFNRDSYACEVDSRTNYFNSYDMAGFMFSQMEFKERYIRCMKMKGYYQIPN